MCSKKVAGVALVITGVVFIAIDIIVGLVLPNAAHKAVEDSTCVNSKESSGYERWVSLSPGSTTVCFYACYHNSEKKVRLLFFLRCI